MDEPTWELVQWVVVESRRGGALSGSLKKRALRHDTFRFLSSEAYLEFLPERRKKVAAHTGASVEPAPDKLALSIAFIVEQLADPELSEQQKDRARSLWRTKNPGVTPPWDQGSAGSGAHGEGPRAH